MRTSTTWCRGTGASQRRCAGRGRGGARSGSLAAAAGAPRSFRSRRALSSLPSAALWLLHPPVSGHYRSTPATQCTLPRAARRPLPAAAAAQQHTTPAPTFTPPPTTVTRNTQHTQIFATLVLLGKNRNNQDLRWVGLRIVLEFLQVSFCVCYVWCVCGVCLGVVCAPCALCVCVCVSVNRPGLLPDLLACDPSPASQHTDTHIHTPTPPRCSASFSTATSSEKEGRRRRDCNALRLLAALQCAACLLLAAPCSSASIALTLLCAALRASLLPRASPTRACSRRVSAKHSPTPCKITTITKTRKHTPTRSSRSHLHQPQVGRPQGVVGVQGSCRFATPRPPNHLPYTHSQPTTAIPGGLSKRSCGLQGSVT